MFAVESTTDIAAPIGRVWRVLADLEGYRQWHPFVALTGPAEPDAEIQMEHRTRIKSLPPISSGARIICFEPHIAIAWRLGIKGLFQVEEGFTLEKCAAGTQVTHRMRCYGVVSMLRFKLLERRMAQSLSVTNASLSRFLARGTTTARYAPRVGQRSRDRR